jgi:uncharacterized protein YneF (UPF0154 family)
MSETTIAAIIGVVATILGTLVGTVLGYFLTRKATKDERDQNDKRQAESTRAIVSLEIERNLDSLRESWTQVNQSVDQSNDTQNRKLELVRRLIELPVSTWKRDALNSQLSILAMALDSREVRQVFQFYDDLAKLETYRSKLIAKDEEQQRAQGVYGENPNIVSYANADDMRLNFIGIASESWGNYELIVTDILDKGNPLPTH